MRKSPDALSTESAHNVPIPLAQAHDRAHYGGKAVGLGQALRAELPVPPGFALPVAFVEAAVADEAEPLLQLEALFTAAGASVAMRSSAVQEDGERASFAGQYVTELNVGRAAALRAALLAVHRSGQSAASQQYRQRLGISGPTRMAAVEQQMIAADTAGVLFTRDPRSGEAACLIEATWGLGEAVVSGRVTPDSFRLGPTGAVLARRAGYKDVQLRFHPDGGIQPVTVAAAEVQALCLTDSQLGQLHTLAERCEQVFGPGLDLEWAFSAGQLYLLQCRPITR